MSGNFKAGEFSIESLSIVNQESESIDVTDLTLTIELFESIYNKFCTGNIILLDGLNILWVVDQGGDVEAEVANEWKGMGRIHR